jgi:hypothetical protein
MGSRYLSWAALAIAMPATAQEVAPSTPATQAPSAQGDVSVTIYNNDLALIQDVRQLDLGSGRVRQDFPDVSAAIRPETVTLAVPGATIVEQNFDYDLLSPTSLMEKAVGKRSRWCAPIQVPALRSASAPRCWR